MLFHSSPASLSFSHFIVIQDTSSVLYRRGHKNFYPFPHLFISLAFFPHSFFFVQLFLFFLVNCVFHWGTSPPLIFFLFPPPRCIITCAALPSSLKFQWSMANRIHSLNYTPEEPPPPLPLLLLSSNHCCSLIPSLALFALLRLPTSVAPFFFAHLLYIRIILHVLSSKRLVPPLLITPWPSLPAHSAGPSVPTLPLTFLLKIKKEKKMVHTCSQMPVAEIHKHFIPKLGFQMLYR